MEKLGGSLIVRFNYLGAFEEEHEFEIFQELGLRDYYVNIYTLVSGVLRKKRKKKKEENAWKNREKVER